MTLAGDADRDRALAALRRHYAAGRLDLDELSRRVHLAAAARSTADLRTALQGLPTHLAATAVRGAKRIAIVAVVGFLWCFFTTAVFVTYIVSLIVSGPSLVWAALFGGFWLLGTLIAWRTARRGARNVL